MPEFKHVHCAECFREVPTTFKDKDGVEHETLIHLGTQGFIKLAPNGPPEIGGRQVPLCNACFDRIEAQEKKGRLLVPKPVMPPVILPGNGRP